LWNYLINVKESEIIGLPDKIEHKDQLANLILEAQHLIGFWLAIGRARPASQPSSMIVNHTDERDSRTWNLSKKHLIAKQLKYIRHWKIINSDYQKCPDIEGTWFIDPPYSNKAGKVYVTKFDDFVNLASWVRNRKGNVIVCEQEGADWLPFKRLKDLTTCKGNSKSEVFYYKGKIGGFGFQL
jgi:hypothetical protein